MLHNTSDMHVRRWVDTVMLTLASVAWYVRPHQLLTAMAGVHLSSLCDLSPLLLVDNPLLLTLGR